MDLESAKPDLQSVFNPWLQRIRLRRGESKEVAIHLEPVGPTPVDGEGECSFLAREVGLARFGAVPDDVG